MRFRSLSPLSWKKKHRRWANFNHWVLHAMLISCHVEPERMGSSSKIMVATAVKDHSGRSVLAVVCQPSSSRLHTSPVFSSKSVILSAVVVVAGSSGAKEGWWRARPCSRYLPTIVVQPEASITWDMELPRPPFTILCHDKKSGLSVDSVVSPWESFFSS